MNIRKTYRGLGEKVLPLNLEKKLLRAINLENPRITPGLRLDYPRGIKTCSGLGCIIKDRCQNYLIRSRGRSRSSGEFSECLYRGGCKTLFLDAGRFKKYGERLGSPDSLSETEYYDVLDLILLYYART